MIIDTQKHIRIFYAVQTCDIKSYQHQERFCSNDRTEISKKCVTSFLQSVKYCADLAPNTEHTILIVDDGSSTDLVDYLDRLVNKFADKSVKINFEILPKENSGIAGSIKHCYLWLLSNAKNDIDLVYQIQDDYMFESCAVYEMIGMWFQMYQETGSHAVISPYNDVYQWLTHYRNRPTPRAIIVGEWRYWIQMYDCSCSWLTSKEQFSSNWDLYLDFFDLITSATESEKLEAKSLNYMFTRRSILGLIPVQSLAFHMQSEFEKDPHIDWRPIWDAIDIDI